MHPTSTYREESRKHTEDEKRWEGGPDLEETEGSLQGRLTPLPTAQVTRNTMSDPEGVPLPPTPRPWPGKLEATEEEG